MTQRFFVSSPIVGRSARLTGAEVQHATKAMRLRTGDSVILFDGSGSEFSARIGQTNKDSIDCEVTAKHPISRELSRSVVLCVALPKGERQRWLVEKTVELGVTTLVPLITQRGVAQPTDNAIARLRRTVVEASKQCGRNQLMEISPPCKLQQADFDSETSCLIAHPSSPPLAQAREYPGALAVAVGPEGGFTDDEVADAVESGWTECSLGPRLLRIETAVVAVAAWASLGPGEQ